jgi:hypothetical protein
MISLETLLKLSAQLRHMDIIEDQLFAAQVQLKNQRTELEEILTTIVKEERENR